MCSNHSVYKCIFGIHCPLGVYISRCMGRCKWKQNTITYIFQNKTKIRNLYNFWSDFWNAIIIYNHWDWLWFLSSKGWWLWFLSTSLHQIYIKTNNFTHSVKIWIWHRSNFFFVIFFHCVFFLFPSFFVLWVDSNLLLTLTFNACFPKSL